jgi:cytochrome c
MNYLMSAAVAALLGAGAAHAQDASAGEEIFSKRCKTCHMLVSDSGEEIVKGGKTGPNLYGVVGRVAASAEDYDRYGDSLKELGETGFEWTEDEIVAYLEDPRAYLRAKLDDKRARSNMAYKLRPEDDRASVAAYLASLEAGS